MALFKIDDVTKLVYEITDTIEIEGMGIEVNVEIAYSGNDGVTEFEWAYVREESNPLLTEDQRNAVNKVLECGLESTYVAELEKHYADTDIKFSPNHYESVL